MGQIKGMIAAAVLALTGGAASAEQVTVFAAASLKTALDQIATDYSAASGDEIVISYAGSGQLAKQILAGAPADIFLSASEDWMEALSVGGAIQEGSRRSLLGNDLVLVGHGTDQPKVEIGANVDLLAALKGGKLAMGLVGSVPAGQYGKAALEHLGLWTAVEPSVAQVDNVRAALALVAQDEAPMGIVYATDAKASPDVSVLGTFPAGSHPEISYPVALTSDSAAARRFYDALSQEAARAVLTAQGFRLID